jgi:purine-binding chemotaxis protein CheW
VVFGLDGRGYALPLHEVERVLPMVEISPLPEAPAIALGVINLQGDIIPVLDLRRRLGLPAREYDPSTQLLVAKSVHRTLALPVDEVLGVREVPTEDVTAPSSVLHGIGQVAGIVALDEGLLFIHDLERALSLEEERLLSEALEAVTQ